MSEQIVGDYDLRGPDFDTALIGPVTPSIVDADRLVRAEWKNGFPNWIMYRTALAGDDLYLRDLRQWAVAFSVTYCTTGGVKKAAYSEELACVAAWEAVYMLTFCRTLQPYSVTAEAIGVDPKTYRRLRDALYVRMKASLDEYWVQLGAAYRHVFLYERKTEHKSRSQILASDLMT